MGKRLAAFLAKRDVEREYKQEILIEETAQEDAEKKFKIDVKPFKTQIKDYRQELSNEIGKNRRFAIYSQASQELPNILSSAESKCDALEELTKSTSEKYAQTARKHFAANIKLNQEMKEFEKEQKAAQKDFFAEVSPFELLSSVFGLSSKKVTDKFKANRQKRKEMMKKFYRQKLEQSEEIRLIEEEFEKKKTENIEKVKAKLDSDSEKGFKKSFENVKNLVANQDNSKDNNSKGKNQNKDKNKDQGKNGSGKDNQGGR